MLKRMVGARNRDSWSATLRRKRFGLFDTLLSQLQGPVRILDIGGTQAFWQTVGFSSIGNVRITLLNLRREPVSLPNFDSVLGDARELAAFAPGSIDIVFSNSVIEHVGSFEDQVRMANEVRRVGKRFFVQTPNRHFPFEPHFMFPCFQFLPVALRVWLLRHFDLGWFPRTPDPEAARRIVQDIRLLSERELRALFPGAAVFRERLAGLTKSLVVYGGW